ncbi:hypothetical protein CCYA_CCYA02G0550 [Cyanidiococcus yangmingshanensis]|nr:hypothetical protein CCYA_CCYA02G0550 [Cyanidiococcus yangmingshanensis]
MTPSRSGRSTRSSEWPSSEPEQYDEDAPRRSSRPSQTSAMMPDDSVEWSSSALGATLIQGLRALLEEAALGVHPDSSGETQNERRRSRRQHLQFQRYASSRLAPGAAMNQASVQADLVFPQALWQLEDVDRPTGRWSDDGERMGAQLNYLSQWLTQRRGNQTIEGTRIVLGRLNANETQSIQPVWAVRLCSMTEALKARECSAEAVPMPCIENEPCPVTEAPKQVVDLNRERMQQFMQLLSSRSSELKLPLDTMHFASFWYRFVYLEKEFTRIQSVRHPRTGTVVHSSLPRKHTQQSIRMKESAESRNIRHAWSCLMPRACTARAPGAADRSVPAGFDEVAKSQLLEHYVPQFECRKLDVYSARAYGCRFFDHGRLLVTSCQDRRLRLYDTASPDVFAWCGGSPEHSLLERWERPRMDSHRCTRLPLTEVVARDLRWTITDVDWYRDAHGSSWLAYASITPRVYLVRLDANAEQEALCFATPAGLAQDQGSTTAVAPAAWPTLLDAENSYGLGIWSIRFRPDGTELLGGTSHTGHVFGDLILYNIERQMPVASLRAHHDDVNSVAYAGPNVFLSAADDAYIHVWDRRDLRQACGSFVGHTEGITHVSWRGEEVSRQASETTDLLDQRYVVSIGKDQRCKVWDIRLLRDPNQVDQPRPSHYDYRWNDIMNPPLDTRRTLRGDTSLYTYIGMRVLSTLIRAYFSPLSTTGGRYVYTGSQDGRVCLFDTISGMPLTALRGHEAAVREMSWSPRLPGVLVSAGWDGQAIVWRPAGVEDA